MNPCPFSCDQSRAEEHLWRAISKLQANDKLPDRGVTTTALQVFYKKLCYCIRKNRDHRGGIIKYETDRGGRNFNILLKNLVAQHKQQREFPGPTVSSKKVSWPPKIFSL